MNAYRKPTPEEGRRWSDESWRIEHDQRVKEWGQDRRDRYWFAVFGIEKGADDGR